MRALILSTAALFLLPAIAGAQNPEQSWDNLQTLRHGEKIQVVDQRLKSQQGTFGGFSEEAITFRMKQDEVTIQRADVFRVSSRERGRTRGRNVLIGLAVGAGVGLGLGAAMYASGGLDISGAETAAFVSAPLSIGLVGAGVGAMLPPGQPTIYRAERRNNQDTP